jgi:NAD(P)-dependent dehydrogenase (short-subunit alcohol dehydrogenase family)
MDLQPLQGRIAIVTGGSSGIGRGICLELAREGARVVVADIQEEPLRGKYFETDVEIPTATAIHEMGGEAIFVQADVTDEAALHNLVAQCVAKYGQLDILVNNAGIYTPGGIQQLTLAGWDRLMNINLRSLYVTMQLALPHLEQSPAGRIINIASVNAFRGGHGPAYSASKAGVVNLTRDVAVELGPKGITVNAICPGAVETAMQDGATEETMAAELKGTPLRRFGTPRDIGRACVFLASDDAAWITGIAMPVDGGLLSGWAR